MHLVRVRVTVGVRVRVRVRLGVGVRVEGKGQGQGHLHVQDRGRGRGRRGGRVTWTCRMPETACDTKIHRPVMIQLGWAAATAPTHRKKTPSPASSSLG